MGKKEGSYIKSMKNLHERINKKKTEIAEMEQQMMVLYKNEKQFWVKTGACSICMEEKEKTEWHHIISQHRCRELSKEYLIYARTNVMEVCKECHDETTASLRRKVMKTPEKVVKNQTGMPTDRQLEYIKKLGGEDKIHPSLTRQQASELIDELKESQV